MDPYKCLVLDNNVQCTFPHMKGYDYCMFHTDILFQQKDLPKLHELVEQKLREGYKFGTLHFPHSAYNWSNSEIVNSIQHLKKHHNLSVKVGIVNTMVYSPRFKTKEEYMQHQKKKQEVWDKFRQDHDLYSESFAEFMLNSLFAPLIIIVFAYLYYVKNS